VRRTASGSVNNVFAADKLARAPQRVAFGRHRGGYNLPLQTPSGDGVRGFWRELFC